MPLFPRRARRFAAALPLLVANALTWLRAQASADHGGATASPPMDPVLVGVIAGGLVLIAGGLVLLIARLLTRKPRPPSE